MSLLVASLIVALLCGSLFAITGPFGSSPLQLAVTTRTAVLPTQAVVTTPTAVFLMYGREAALTICEPDDPAPTCLPGELDPSQNLANPANGLAQPAVAKDARPAHPAQYGNDGLGETSWVSNSADSWIKVDLGQVQTFNLVRLEIGDSSPDNDLGQFVIAVAPSDLYADGDSTNDHREYTPVFDSERAGFSGTVPHTATIHVLFSPVNARYVKILFEQAGVDIEEVGVFMVEPEQPAVAGQLTGTPQGTLLPGFILVTGPTSTSVANDPSTSIPSIPTNPPAATAVPSQRPTNTPRPSNTPSPQPTRTQPPANTPLPSNTSAPQPTNTQPPADTATPIPPTDPLPTLPLPTLPLPTLPLPTLPLPTLSLPIPTVILPTVIIPTLPLPIGSIERIAVTEGDQTVIVTCRDNAAEIRGRANTVTRLGSCSHITVTHNGHRVFRQSGSPVNTTKGNDTIVRQL